MKECFSEMRLGSAKLAVIKRANSIIEDFQSQGYRMTLRQLYYQFVTKNWVTNEEKSYKNLAGTISDGRLCGLIDWDAIEDRGRVADVPHHYDDAADLVATMKRAAANFTLDRWSGQPVYVELWVEKQALAGVLEPLAQRHHVTLMVNKGYSSQSAMFAAAQRFREGMGTTGDRDQFDPDYHHCKPADFAQTAWRNLESERDGLLLYLGDHDPSGEDMVRDIRDRLTTFGCGEQLEVRKVALTTEQVRQYNPPPNPAKVTDSRAAAYIARHGPSSWEVDSLDPPVLGALVTQAITEVIDTATLAAVKAGEAVVQTKLAKALTSVKFG